ncbi:MAG: ATP-binding protein [Gallionellaceae bacterium]|nr:ATP-binding protein [Gallionellaceae bacterium]
MNRKFAYLKNSLKIRLTFFTLTIFLIGLWSLLFYANYILREDIKQLLGDQQFSAVSFVAQDVGLEVSDRLAGLSEVAKEITPDLLNHPARLQTYLESLPVFLQQYSGGTMVLREDGTCIASAPLSWQRTGGNYADREHVILALKSGKTNISKGLIGKKSHAPLLSFTTPILDKQKRIIGALSGVLNLSRPSFLDTFANSHYGKSGAYFLVDKKNRMIITSTGKKRLLETFSEHGILPKIDKFLDGYEGSAVYVNRFGVEVLGSAKSIEGTDWFLGATLPITEAFAPIHNIQLQMLYATIALTLLAGGMTWWVVRRELAPMQDAVNTMTAMTATKSLPQPIPVLREDEIGTMIKHFNLLIQSLSKRDQALDASNQRALNILEASPISFAINDDLGNIIYLNQAFTHLLGYTLADIPTLAAWWPLAYPDAEYQQRIAKAWQENVAQSRQSKQPFVPMEVEVCCKDGSKRTLLVTTTLLEDGDVATNLVAFYDITDRKQAELKLLATSKLLKEAQHIAQIGNWQLDLVSGTLIWSDEIFTMFEIDQSKFTATYEAFLNAIHPDDRDLVNNAYGNSLITHEPYEVTHRLRMSDGRIKWVNEKCNSTFNAEGKPLESRGMVQDITQSKLNELALIQARDEANSSNRAKSAFLSSMSHELRTPMNAILGFSQLMQMDENFPANHKENVEDMLSAGYHLLDLIDEVLDLAKIESGKIDLRLSNVVLCDVLNDCLKIITLQAEKRKITVSHVGQKNAIVVADRRRLKQVFINLMSNGIKYNRENGQLHIEVKPMAAGKIRILVIDSGLGIAADRLPELFEPFNRLGAESGEIEGSGIGLTITRRILEAMNGTINVESQVGVGSTFWIELPVAVD